MSKIQQVLVIDPPNELTFKGPFNASITKNIKLHNPSTRPTCFKVKTTAPKWYCVRPNSGIIQPGADAHVAVVLQPFTYDPNDKTKHKFMVQSLFAPEGVKDCGENLWKDTPADQIMDSKLRCVFENPDEVLQNNLNKARDEKTSIIKEPLVDANTNVPGLTQALTDPKKVFQEIQKLKDDIKMLTRENQTLKEEGARFRRMAVYDSVKPTADMPASRYAAQRDTHGYAIPPIVYVLVAVVLGLILGKVFL